jgi:hypothetical protein
MSQMVNRPPCSVNANRANPAILSLQATGKSKDAFAALVVFCARRWRGKYYVDLFRSKLHGSRRGAR